MRRIAEFRCHESNPVLGLLSANGFHVRRIKPLEDDSLRPAEIRDQKANSFSDSDKRDEAGLEHV